MGHERSKRRHGLKRPLSAIFNAVTEPAVSPVNRRFFTTMAEVNVNESAPSLPCFKQQTGEGELCA